MVLRLRLSDPEPDDGSTPVGWRFAALLTATLFLNFHFWFVHGLDLWRPGPPLRNAGLLGAGALLIAALFFVGPALATQAARRPLLGVAESSLGSIPAFGLRLCCLLFLVGWISSLVAEAWMWWLYSILRRDISPIESGLIAAGVLVFLFVTGLQSLRTSAKLAVFTNKLGIAILIASLLRVREGWLPALGGSTDFAVFSGIPDLWHGLALLSFYVAPLAFLAADFGHRSQGRKQVAMVALLGLALPLSGTLFVVGLISDATFASRFYQPSLPPSVAMALWGQAARSSLPGGMLVAAITTFGAVRFGAMALAETVSKLAPGRRPRWALLGCFIGAIVWLAIREETNFSVLFDLCGTCIAVAAAVLTVDFVTTRWRTGQVRKIDWVGVAALLSGLATPLYLPGWIVGGQAERWWHPWLLPSYAVGFLVCLFGRAVQKLRVAPQLEKVPQ
jgi:hypothetical protein